MKRCGGAEECLLLLWWQCGLHVAGCWQLQPYCLPPHTHTHTYNHVCVHHPLCRHFLYIYLCLHTTLHTQVLVRCPSAPRSSSAATTSKQHPQRLSCRRGQRQCGTLVQTLSRLLPWPTTSQTRQQCCRCCRTRKVCVCVCVAVGKGFRVCVHIATESATQTNFVDTRANTCVF